MARLCSTLLQTIDAGPDSQEQGFALTALLLLLPLALGLAAAFGAAVHVLRTKSLAQSLCVREAAATQEELAVSLRELIALNPTARRLRRERERAERHWRAALATEVPPLIAAARAELAAVTLAQLRLRQKQSGLLREAETIRSNHTRELAARLRRLTVSPLQAPMRFNRALAVTPVPPASLTPDYLPAPGFEFAQQQRFLFRVDLSPPWPLETVNGADVRQAVECSVSLRNEGGKKWDIDILAASAPSKSR